jgi:hypothetical protein
VKDAERKGEIERFRTERYVSDAMKVVTDVFCFATSSAAGLGSSRWRCSTRGAINIDQRPLATADIEPHTAAGRQTIPGKDAEIIVEDRLTLLVREMIRVLPEVRPFAPEAAYDQRIPVIAGSILN